MPVMPGYALVVFSDGVEFGRRWTKDDFVATVELLEIIGTPTKEGYHILGYKDSNGTDIDLTSFVYQRTSLYATEQSDNDTVLNIYTQWEGDTPPPPKVIIHGSVGTRKAIQTITPPWAPKDKTELEALGSNNAILAELNAHPDEYYNFFLEGTPEGLDVVVGSGANCTRYSHASWRIAFPEGTYNCYRYDSGAWALYRNISPA